MLKNQFLARGALFFICLLSLSLRAADRRVVKGIVKTENEHRVMYVERRAGFRLVCGFIKATGAYYAERTNGGMRQRLGEAEAHVQFRRLERRKNLDSLMRSFTHGRPSRPHQKLKEGALVR